MLPDAASTHGARTQHHPALAHHFDNLEQQNEAATLGMWVFLVTEVLFFGGLFAGLHDLPHLVSGRVRRGQPRARRHARHDQHRRPDHQQPDHGAGGARGADSASARQLMLFLVADDGPRRGVPRDQERRVLRQVRRAPRARARTSSSRPEYFRHAQIFFSLYFVMTGLHALHMIIGLGIMTCDAVVVAGTARSPASTTARSRSAASTGTSSTSSGSSCSRCSI